MPIRTTVMGSYPKVTETGTDNLAGTIDRWQRKLINDEVLEQEIQKVIRRVIGEQEQANLTLITDGQIRWEDLPHGIARSAQGLNRGALRRFFDNNVYYRRLELNGGVSFKTSAAAEEFRFASQIAKSPIKVALPGPLTLVISTEAKPGQTPEKLLSLYADLLRKEVEQLASAGVKEIQLDEPALKPGEPLLPKAIDAINRIFQGIKARRWVATYFHDVSAILPTLAKLQVEVLGLDLVTAPQAAATEATAAVRRHINGGTADRLKEIGWKGEVCLGLIDARNTKLESAPDVARRIQEISRSIPVERLWLSPNCGLEFLPHESAVKKLRLLQEIAAV